MSALFEAILTHVPPPAAQADLPLQLQISTLDYKLLRLGASASAAFAAAWCAPARAWRCASAIRTTGSPGIGQVLTFTGLERNPVGASERRRTIVAVTGIESVNIGMTICDPAAPTGAAAHQCG